MAVDTQRGWDRLGIIQASMDLELDQGDQDMALRRMKALIQRSHIGSSFVLTGNVLEVGISDQPQEPRSLPVQLAKIVSVEDDGLVIKPTETEGAEELTVSYQGLKILPYDPRLVEITTFASRA